ncbi:MAG TPA: A24 family peptidase [Candidatus Solibacter sp.]|nr:A24 family peptidase [Candidatus Solibacter sp.]
MSSFSISWIRRWSTNGKGTTSEAAEKLDFERFREGHEFHSCRKTRQRIRGFSRWGNGIDSANVKPIILAGAVLLAAIAGWTDFRSRRIPNWLTVPAAAIGVAVNVALSGLHGLKDSLLGVGLGLALLLPFVLLRSLGAGDWKLAGALGAFTGPGLLTDLLLGSVFVAGVMALALVIYKGRLRQTLRNIGHIIISLVTFRLPGERVTLDNPDSLKVPYGVALACTVVLYAAAHARGVA